MDLLDVYRTFHPTSTQYTFFSAAWFWTELAQWESRGMEEAALRSGKTFWWLEDINSDL
jgi:hypothetical protein